MVGDRKVADPVRVELEKELASTCRANERFDSPRAESPRRPKAWHKDGLLTDTDYEPAIA
jgi:hypothetical protein